MECFCDATCHFFGDCCRDIDEICPRGNCERISHTHTHTHTHLALIYANILFSCMCGLACSTGTVTLGECKYMPLPTQRFTNGLFCPASSTHIMTTCYSLFPCSFSTGDTYLLFGNTYHINRVSVDGSSFEVLYTDQPLGGIVGLDYDYRYK